MSLINSLRSGVGWVSERNAGARELIKIAKAERLKLLSRRRNAHFVRSHPGEPFPPLDLMVDAHAHSDYKVYYETGLAQARFFVSMFGKHFDFAQREPVRILEWGCGPGRVVRHLRKLYDESAVSILASDYNAKSVEWCRQSFPGISFFLNDVAPPLDLDDASIDIAYSRSVFTHLTDEMCRLWMKELARVVRPGGLISFTAGGWRFRDRFQEREQEDYRRGIPQYRAWDQVGRRDFFAWHPPEYVRRVFLPGLDELEYFSSEEPGQTQNLWLTRVPQAIARAVSVDARSHPDAVQS